MDGHDIDHSRLEAAMSGILKSLSDIRITNLSCIKIHRHLKSGGFGDVYVGELSNHNSEGTTLVAVKQLRPHGSRDDCIRVAAALGRELRAWARLSHPNILAPLGFYIDSINYTKAWLLTAWQVHGDLPHFLAKENPDFQERLHLALDTAEGLAYLHNLDPPVCHADVKPENALVNAKRRVLLSDFGLARTIGDATSGLTTSTIAMSCRYASPEQIEENVRGTLQSDVWSWGCLFLETITGKAPYAETKLDLQVLLAIQLRTPPANLDTLNLPNAICDILEWCWKPADQRPTMKACLESLASICLVREGQLQPRPIHDHVEPPSYGLAEESGAPNGWAFELAAGTRRNIQFGELSQFNKILASDFKFSPDGLRVAMIQRAIGYSDWYGETFRVYKTKTGAAVSALEKNPEATYQTISHYTWNSESKLVAVNCNLDIIQIWNVAAAAIIQVILHDEPGGRFSCVQFSPVNATALATVDQELPGQARLRIWNAEDGTTLWTTRVGEPIKRLDFIHSSIVLADYRWAWDTKTGAPVAEDTRSRPTDQTYRSLSDDGRFASVDEETPSVVELLRVDGLAGSPIDGQTRPPPLDCSKLGSITYPAPSSNAVHFPRQRFSITADSKLIVGSRAQDAGPGPLQRDIFFWDISSPDPIAMSATGTVTDFTAGSITFSPGSTISSGLFAFLSEETPVFNAKLRILKYQTVLNEPSSGV